MSGTSQSPNQVSQEDIENHRNSSDSSADQIIISPRSGDRQSHSKCALMDRGDATSPADHDKKEDCAKTGDAKPPLSSAVLDRIIGEAIMGGQAEYEVACRLGGRMEEEYYARTEEFLEEDEVEIETLVRLVIEKATKDLIVESLRKVSALQDDADSSTASLPSLRGLGNYSQFSDQVPVQSHSDGVRASLEVDENWKIETSAHEGHGTQETVTDEDGKDAADCYDEVEEDLDAFIKLVLDKAEEDVIGAEREVSHSKNLGQEADEAGAADDNSEELAKSYSIHETGLDFGFHDVICRLIDDRYQGGWEEKDEKADEMNEEECLRMKEGSLEVQSVRMPQEVPGEVQGEEADEEVQHTTANPDTLAVEANHAPLEVTSEVDDTANVEALPSCDTATVQKASNEAHLELEPTEAMSSEATGEDSSEEDDYDDISTSDDEELDSMVGFVINAARSSLQDTFDVFNFKKSLDHLNTGPADKTDTGKIISDNDSFSNELKPSTHIAEDLGFEKMDSAVVGGEVDRPEQDLEKEAIERNSEEAEQPSESRVPPLDVTKKEDDDLRIEVECESTRSGHFIESPDDKEDKIICTTTKSQEGEKTSSHSEDKTDLVQNAAILNESQQTTKGRGDSDDCTRERQPSSTEDQDKRGTEGAVGDGESQEVERNETTTEEHKKAHFTTSNKTDDHTMENSSSGVKLQTSIVEPVHVTFGSQSKLSDDSNKDHASCSYSTPTTPIDHQASLMISGISADSDDDSDISDSEDRAGDRINLPENDWECLAIRHISKYQEDFVLDGQPFHSWYPAHGTENPASTDISKKTSEIYDQCLEADRKCKPASKESSSIQPSEAVKIADAVHMPKTMRNTNTTAAPQAAQSPNPQAGKDTGMALINDSLRKKILLLEERLKQLVLELTFLGDRNWRLEAYIDCLVKTLEEMEVTDVVDLDQKTLPLDLFKVKVKAGYKLGSYNGIPSRSLWSYAKEGRQPPLVDLSGWGDTEHLDKIPEAPSSTPVPSCDDDVGLSVTQMYQYESQLEELTLQNQILQAELQEANDRAQAVIEVFDGVDESQVECFVAEHQDQQLQRDQCVQTAQQDALPQDLKVLQENLHQLRENQEDDEEFWSTQQQQMHFQSELQHQHQPFIPISQQLLEQQQECYVVHEGKQYSLPNMPLPMPLVQNHPGQASSPQQQQQHQYQYEPQQVQEQQQQRMDQQFQAQPPHQPQQGWNHKIKKEKASAPVTEDWDSTEQFSFQDPTEWPTLTESQAKMEGNSVPKSSAASASSDSHHPLDSQQFANGPSHDITPSDPPKALYSPLAVPASTGSIPSKENRYRSPNDDDKSKHKTRSSMSCQSLRNGRRFENDRNRRPARYSPSPLNQSQSGIDSFSSTTGFRRQEESRMNYRTWEPTMGNYSSPPVFGKTPSFNGESRHRDRPNYQDHTGTGTGPRSPQQRHNPGRNRRFLCGDSVSGHYRPDFRDVKHDPTFHHGESASPTSDHGLILDGVNNCEFSSQPLDNRSRFGGSSTSFNRHPYPRQHDRRPAASQARGKPWNRPHLPRHSSYTSPVRSRATSDLE